MQTESIELDCNDAPWARSVNAWLHSEKLRDDALNRVDREVDRLTDAMMGGQFGTFQFPELLGLPTHLGFALDVLHSRAPADVARTLGPQIVAAIAIGVDVTSAPLDLMIEILRRKQGRDHPLAASAVTGMIEAAEQRAGLRRFQIKDAACECEHARVSITRKLSGCDPRMRRAWEACHLGEILGNLLSSDAFMDQGSKAVAHAFWWATDERDIDAYLVEWLVNYLCECKDEPGYDPDFEMFWPKRGLQPSNR